MNMPVAMMENAGMKEILSFVRPPAAIVAAVTTNENAAAYWNRLMVRWMRAATWRKQHSTMRAHTHTHTQ